MVGRFVEQQQFGRAHQRLRQVQAHPPATGEVADAAVHLLGREAQAGQQLARAGVRGVSVSAVQFAVQARQGSAVVGVFRRGQIRLNLAQVHVAVEHVIDGEAVEGIDLLAHMRDAPVRRQVAVAGVLAELAAQQGEQARLAGAVGADQADFLSGVQGEFGTFQQALGATL